MTAGWSNTGSLCGLGGWGVGAIQWIGAEAPRSPEILNAEARLSGEGGFTIAGDKVTQLMATGAILAGAGQLVAHMRRLHYIWDDSDIGQPPRGRRTAKPFALQRAEDKLKAGYSKTKKALAEEISKEIEQHYRHTDGLTMCWENVYDVITPVWQRLRGDAA
jgi:hypothetical protein